jgi:hypothetical protein
MDSSKLLKSKNYKLEELPEVPAIFWYPSSGTTDFRSLVYLTQNRIDHFRKHNKKEFIHPDLFVFNTLGNEVSELKNQLKNGDTVIFEDSNTKIIGKDFKQLQTNSELLQFEIDPKYIELEGVKLPQKFMEIFYFQATVTGMDYEETQKVLFIEAENHDVYRKIILKESLFNTVYFCNCREGLAWGRSKESILKEIYSSSKINSSGNENFHPEFVIAFNDYTKDLLKSSLNAARVKYIEDYANYIWEVNWKDSTVFRLFNNKGKVPDMSLKYL